MEIHIIKTDKQYKAALKELERVFDAEPGTAEGERHEILVMLIEKYETEHFPIDIPDPIEAIKFRMDQMGYEQKDLNSIIGYKGRVSEILNKKRKLTLEMIRRLHDKLNIPTDVLIREY